MIQIFRNSIDTLSYYSRSIDQQINEAKVNNERKAKMDNRRDTIINAVNFLEHKKEITHEMIREINITLKNSKEARKQFIVDEIERALEIVFDQGYKVSLELKPYRDTYKADLMLYTENENGVREYFRPETQNGGLCRQVIALSTGLAIAKLMNCHTIFMDEALNGGDSVKLRKMQEIIQSFLDYHPDNVIILNEHNGSLYQDVSCRIFNFHKEGKGMTGYVQVDEVIDQEGEDLSKLIL